jgi:hypothetical protein
MSADLLARNIQEALRPVIENYLREAKPDMSPAEIQDKALSLAKELPLPYASKIWKAGLPPKPKPAPIESGLTNLGNYFNV